MEVSFTHQLADMIKILSVLNTKLMPENMKFQSKAYEYAVINVVDFNFIFMQISFIS